MVVRTACVCLLLGTVASAADNTPTPPVRPAYRDVSLKIANADPSYPYKWFRGRTATQVQRDAMQETLVGVAVPEAIRYARSMRPCSGAVKTAISNLGKITAKLGPEYELNTLLPGGRWTIPPSGRHYHDEQYALKAIRQCSIGGGADACAGNPLMTPDLLDLLDLRIERGKCVTGATFEPADPIEPFDAQRAGVGTIQSATLMQLPSSKQMALLQKTMQVHTAVSNARCGTGAEPAAGVVTSAHMALEATATSEKQHHFLRMKAFSGAVDPQWTPAEECKWARLQDLYHHQWMEAVARGDWGHSREAENNHQLAHICMNLRDPRLKVKFSCPPQQDPGLPGADV